MVRLGPTLDMTITVELAVIKEDRLWCYHSNSIQATYSYMVQIFLTYIFIWSGPKDSDIFNQEIVGGGGVDWIILANEIVVLMQITKL